MASKRRLLNPKRFTPPVTSCMVLLGAQIALRLLHPSPIKECNRDVKLSPHCIARALGLHAFLNLAKHDLLKNKAH